MHPTASKPEIHQAVEKIWGVKVVSVNTVNRKGKASATGARTTGRRVNTKRAIVKLAEGERIEMFEGCRYGTSKAKPISPARRFQSVADFKEITKDTPERTLLGPEARQRRAQQPRPQDRPPPGGGHKQHYRVIDFRRNKDGVPAKVAAVEYDPNRNCRILLLHYVDGEKRYILAPRA